jgi:hypothetical protein
MYVSVSGFEHGGPFDPKVGSTMIYLGRAAQPPRYAPQRNKVTNVSRETEVKEGERKQVKLPAGRYWLWSSNTVFVRVEVCNPGGISEVTPSP